ncbi:ArsR family transcriptional regulator [Arthrobacter sp. ZBG10]|jgi:DNA-binding MarR family transcriptional regulator|uniref:MarR family winged helix-turn-helix transcriptional regulator n=1 Tax=Micrococcaceae TaxID=1268 RepID=UPI000682C235|nr:MULTISPECIES: MarR family transcriptional regulator [Micrococcaceae]KNH19620.1 ArsR family transcriptional regulator [Arthrobacter sp. ZBG10]KQR01920.1 ArsR family transcriptional regulator [Arthrobacter sp. Leaf141]
MDPAKTRREAALPPVASPFNHRPLAVAVLDISFEVRRKSHEGTGVLPLSSGVLDVIRVIERHPGITVAEVAARLGRQLSNVSAQLRELVALGLVTRTRDAADKRYVALHATAESRRIKSLLEGAWAGALATATDKLTADDLARLAAALPALERLAAILHEPDA